MVVLFALEAAGWSAVAIGCPVCDTGTGEQVRAASDPADPQHAFGHTTSDHRREHRNEHGVGRTLSRLHLDRHRGGVDVAVPRRPAYGRGLVRQGAARKHARGLGTLQLRRRFGRPPHSARASRRGALGRFDLGLGLSGVRHTLAGCGVAHRTVVCAKPWNGESNEAARPSSATGLYVKLHRRERNARTGLYDLKLRRRERNAKFQPMMKRISMPASA